jgi:hypothetical protein
MKLELLTGAELARYTGVSRAAITTATKEGRLYRDPITKKYDPTHTANLAFINANRLKAVTTAEIEDGGPDNLPDVSPDSLPESLQALYKRKLKAEAEKAEAQAWRIKIDNAMKKKEIVPFDVVVLGFGAMGSAVRTEILHIGERVSRTGGGEELRRRIEDQTARAIDRAKKMATLTMRECVDVSNPGQLEEIFYRVYSEIVGHPPFKKDEDMYAEEEN